MNPYETSRRLDIANPNGSLDKLGASEVRGSGFDKGDTYTTWLHE